MNIVERWEHTGLLKGLSSKLAKEEAAEHLEDKTWELLKDFSSGNIDSAAVNDLWETFLIKLQNTGILIPKKEK
jgi:hypothetical protein